MRVLFPGFFSFSDVHTETFYVNYEYPINYGGGSGDGGRENQWASNAFFLHLQRDRQAKPLLVCRQHDRLSYRTIQRVKNKVHQKAKMEITRCFHRFIMLNL